MAALWTVPGINHFVIGTDRDKMGLNDWEIFLVDLQTGNVTNETDNVEVSEIIYNIDNPATGTIAADVSAGSKILPLVEGDGAKFKAGMKVSIPTSEGTELKEIRLVTGDTITFYKPLKGNVVADTDDDETADAQITQVGNSGDYRVVVNTENLTGSVVSGGDYQVQVTSEAGEIDVTSEIFHATDYDYDNLKGDIDYLKTGIDNLINGGLGGARIYI